MATEQELRLKNEIDHGMLPEAEAIAYSSPAKQPEKIAPKPLTIPTAIVIPSP